VRAMVTGVVTLDQPFILGKAVTLQGMRAYRLRARGRDPSTGKMREFESANLWRAPVAEAGLTTVTVHVQRNDPACYVVDETTLEPAPGGARRTQSAASSYSERAVI